MNKNTKRHIRDFLIVMGICSAITLLGVLITKPPSYSAFFVFLFLVLPITLILFVSAIVMACLNNAKLSAILLSCCVWLPVSFFIFSALLNSLGIIGHISSDGTDLKERIVVAIKENHSNRDFRRFYYSVPQKTISNSNGTHIERAEGVCFVGYLPDEFKYEVVDIGFCNDATEEQKKKIRDEVNSTEVIYKIFENLRMEDIRKLPLEKKSKVDNKPVENAKEAIDSESEKDTSER